MMGDPTGMRKVLVDYLRLADLQRRNLSEGEVKPSGSLVQPSFASFHAAAGHVIGESYGEKMN